MLTKIWEPVWTCLLICSKSSSSRASYSQNCGHCVDINSKMVSQKINSQACSPILRPAFAAQKAGAMGGQWADRSVVLPCLKQCKQLSSLDDSRNPGLDGLTVALRPLRWTNERWLLSVDWSGLSFSINLTLWIIKSKTVKIPKAKKEIKKLAQKIPLRDWPYEKYPDLYLVGLKGAINLYYDGRGNLRHELRPACSTDSSSEDNSNISSSVVRVPGSDTLFSNLPTDITVVDDDDDNNECVSVLSDIE